MEHSDKAFRCWCDTIEPPEPPSDRQILNPWIDIVLRTAPRIDRRPVEASEATYLIQNQNLRLYEKLFLSTPTLVAVAA